MKGIIIAFFIIGGLASFVCYCCVCVGVQADKRMEELQWKEEKNAG